MRQIAVVVEGPTEQGFIEQVLQQYLGDDVWLRAIIVTTSRTASGSKHRGGGRWRNYERELRVLSSQPHWDLITTMVDLYAFPDDGPGCKCSPQHDPVPCARDRSTRIRAALNDPRVQPFITVHEFEALVLAAASEAEDFFGDTELTARVRALVQLEHDGDAERIDGGRQTAPSKRLKELYPPYAKTRDGVALLQAVGLERALLHAPHASEWVHSLVSGSSTR